MEQVGSWLLGTAALENLVLCPEARFKGSQCLPGSAGKDSDVTAALIPTEPQPG